MFFTKNGPFPGSSFFIFVFSTQFCSLYLIENKIANDGIRTIESEIKGKRVIMMFMRDRETERQIQRLRVTVTNMCNKS